MVRVRGVGRLGVSRRRSREAIRGRWGDVVYYDCDCG